MNVVLIYPTFHNWETWPPLALACLASFLRQEGHDVSIVDRNVLLHRKGTFSQTDLEMGRLLRHQAPDIVGITATTPLIVDAFHCADLARQTIPSAKIVLGGIHASIMPESCLQECHSLDYVCRGEGEFTLKELAAGKDIQQISGLYYRENDRIVSTAPREYHRALDDFGLPARDLLDMELYLKPSPSVIRGFHLRATHLFTGIGCTASCHFCAWPGMYGRRIRLHSADYIFREVKHLVDDYRVEGLYFAEEMFFCDKKRVAELCQLLVDSGYSKKVKLCVQLRADVVEEEKLQALKRAGFVQIEYGIESGSQRVLDLMNKRTTVEQNRRAIALTQKAGIRALANIIVGTPGETKSDLLDTARFLRETTPDYVAVNRFVPFPGSHFFNVLNEQDRVSHNWMDYWCTDVETNYSDIADRDFLRLFLSLRARYQITNTLNSLRWNVGVRPSYVAKFPYYLLKDPARFLFRQAAKRLRKSGTCVGNTQTC
jgi:anaerobic magnesium-protoporphyrin IX monomethyl ester cyclase